MNRIRVIFYIILFSFATFVEVNGQETNTIAFDTFSHDRAKEDISVVLESAETANDKIICYGRLLNNGTMVYSEIELEAIFYDRSDQVVVTVNTIVDSELLPQDNIEFSVSADNDKRICRCDVSVIKAESREIDAKDYLTVVLETAEIIDGKNKCSGYVKNNADIEIENISLICYFEDSEGKTVSQDEVKLAKLAPNDVESFYVSVIENQDIATCTALLTEATIHEELQTEIEMTENPISEGALEISERDASEDAIIYDNNEIIYETELLEDNNALEKETEGDQQEKQLESVKINCNSWAGTIQDYGAVRWETNIYTEPSKDYLLLSDLRLYAVEQGVGTYSIRISKDQRYSTSTISFYGAYNVLPFDKSSKQLDIKDESQRNDYEELNSSTYFAAFDIVDPDGDDYILLYSVYSGTDEIEPVDCTLIKNGHGFASDIIQLDYDPNRFPTGFQLHPIGILPLNDNTGKTQLILGEFKLEEQFDTEYGIQDILYDGEENGFAIVKISSKFKEDEYQIRPIINGKGEASVSSEGIEEGDYQFEVIGFYPVEVSCETFSLSLNPNRLKDNIQYWSLEDVIKKYKWNTYYFSYLEDGSCVFLDTDPTDTGSTAMQEYCLTDIEDILEYLGVSENVFTRMLNTTAADGKQFEFCKDFTVGWEYSSMKGLEVIFLKQ